VLSCTRLLRLRCLGSFDRSTAVAGYVRIQRGQSARLRSCRVREVSHSSKTQKCHAWLLVSFLIAEGRRSPRVQAVSIMLSLANLEHSATDLLDQFLISSVHLRIGLPRLLFPPVLPSSISMHCSIVSNTLKVDGQVGLDTCIAAQKLQKRHHSGVE